jgi:hypothetical protein
MSTATTHIPVQVRLVPETCCGCLVTFGLNVDHYNLRRSDHQPFWCPNCGKQQYYSGPTEAQKERDRRLVVENQLAAERARHDQTRAEKQAVKNQLRSTKGVVTRTKRRVSNGVCPCCNRHFTALQRHMASQHPDYSHEESK